MKRRNTAQKALVLNALQCLNHPSAEQIFEFVVHENAEMSLATVYRNLGVLLQEGLAVKLPTTATKDRYDCDTSNHYHFKCNECENLIDLPLNYLSELDEKCESALGVKVEKHSIKFSGICNHCQKQQLN